ncbi:MAG TPA: hypothetical protein VNB22_11385 [Pyrinomonadaceae bacterium]|jgi:hypothetical protein|nr:hypothetical protein [Pyrinomonadaceae bacterium]
MSILNLGKFTECLGNYKRHCDRTFWTKNELPKFYFANLLSRRIQLSVQSAKMVFEICRRVQEKDYYYKATDTKICGMQFLPGTGRQNLSEPILEADAELFKDLVYLNWSEPDFAKKSISYNALSGWLGTLLPHKFIPVTSNHFRHTISYLFDLELKIYQERDFDYFVHSQKYFYLTKKRLKEFNLDSLYLKEISEYVKFAYPKSIVKKDYEEHDWNWITNDFHLFVYREVLGLDSNVKIPAFKKLPEISSRELLNGFSKPEILNIYVP